MNVAALLQDSPSEERRRANSFGSSSNQSPTTAAATQPSQPSQTSWPPPPPAPPPPSSSGTSSYSSSPNRTRPPSAPSHSPPASAHSHPIYSPYPPVPPSAGQAAAAPAPPAVSRPVTRSPVQQLSSASSSPPSTSRAGESGAGAWGPTSLPGRPPSGISADRERAAAADLRAREKESRILNIMDWQGERSIYSEEAPDEGEKGRQRRPGSAPHVHHHHQIPLLAPEPVAPIVSAGLPHRSHQPPPPHIHASHSHSSVPIPAPISAPQPGTLSLVPPQHQHSHQQHQLAQQQAQQQQMHVSAQAVQGPPSSTVGVSALGSMTGVVNMSASANPASAPVGGTILNNLNLGGKGEGGSSAPGNGANKSEPQRQFQNQFHTQFVPGLTSQQQAQVQRERERDRDRDRDREQEMFSRPPLSHPIGYGLGHPTRSPLPAPGPPMAVAPGAGAGGSGMGVLVPSSERERERDSQFYARERERERVRERDSRDIRDREGGSSSRRSSHGHPHHSHSHSHSHHSHSSASTPGPGPGPPPTPSSRSRPVVASGPPPTRERDRPGPEVYRERDGREMVLDPRDSRDIRDRERDRERDLRERDLREREQRERERERERELRGDPLNAHPPHQHSHTHPHVHLHPHAIHPAHVRDREREREREREWEREMGMGGPGGIPGQVGGAGGIPLHRDRDRDREQREREAYLRERERDSRTLPLDPRLEQRDPRLDPRTLPLDPRDSRQLQLDPRDPRERDRELRDARDVRTLSLDPRERDRERESRTLTLDQRDSRSLDPRDGRNTTHSLDPRDARERERERERERDVRERERDRDRDRDQVQVLHRDPREIREREHREVFRERERERMRAAFGVGGPGPGPEGRYEDGVGIGVAMIGAAEGGMGDPGKRMGAGREGGGGGLPPFYDPVGIVGDEERMMSIGMGMSMNVPMSMGSGPVSSEAMPTVMGMGGVVGGWEEEREVKSRVKIDLGTFVWPRTPFPYFFDQSRWVVPCRGGVGKGRGGVEGELEGKEKEDVKEKEGREKEKKEGQQKAEEDKMVVDGEGTKKDKAKETTKEKEGKAEDDKDREQGGGTNASSDANANQSNTSTAQPVVISLEERLSTPPSSSGVKTNAPGTSTKTENENENDTEEESDDPEMLDSETIATVIIPSGFLPLEKPRRQEQMKIWGGGVLSGPGTGFGGYERERERERGRAGKKWMNAGGGKVMGEKERFKPGRKRRIYTDDSDIFLCALHSGWVTWSGARKARVEGLDMRVKLRIIRCLGVREEAVEVERAREVVGAGAGASAGDGAEVNGSRKVGVFGGAGAGGGVHINGKSASASTSARGALVNGSGGPGAGGSPSGPPSAGGLPTADENRWTDFVACRRGKEEVVARFMGGMGEMYFGGDNKSKMKIKPQPQVEEKGKGKEGVEDAKMNEKEEGEVVDNVEGKEKVENQDKRDNENNDDDTRMADADTGVDVDERERDRDVLGSIEDDGRSLLSAGWGIGHDGSAIEVLDVEFISPKSSRGPSVRTRSQRLLEYAERRAAIFRDQAERNKGSFVTTSVIGRKRRRALGPWETSYPVHTPRWGFGGHFGSLRRQPNAVPLDVIREEDEGNVEELERGVVDVGLVGSGVGVGDEDEDKALKGRTVLFSRGAEPWYKYEPESLRAAVLFPQSGEEDLRPSKRRRTDSDTDIQAATDNTPFLLEWDGSNQCCIIRPEPHESTEPTDSSPQPPQLFGVFITAKPLTRQYLRYRFPRELIRVGDTQDQDVVMNGTEGEVKNPDGNIPVDTSEVKESGPSTTEEKTTSSAPMVQDNGHSEPASVPDKLPDINTEDWIAERRGCYHSKDQDVWLVDSGCFQFLDDGIRIGVGESGVGKMLPVKRWKLLDCSSISI